MPSHQASLPPGGGGQDGGDVRPDELDRAELIRLPWITLPPEREGEARGGRPPLPELPLLFGMLRAPSAQPSGHWRDAGCAPGQRTQSLGRSPLLRPMSHLPFCSRGRESFGLSPGNEEASILLVSGN